MNKIEHMTKQQKVLEAFYKEYFKKTNIRFCYWLAAGFLLGVTGLVVLLPYQGLSTEVKVIAVVAQIFGTTCYLSPYTTGLDESGMITPLYSRMQYLPVSSDIMGAYRFHKMVRLQLKIYFVLQIGQLICSMLAYHEVGLGNVLYPMFVCGLAPIACFIVDRTCDNR